IANIYAFREAVAHASRSHAPDYLILDWLTLPGIHLPSISTSHAESKSWSVAAASIVAKVFRDRLMRDDYDLFFPEYGLASHKGYGTLAHRENMKQYGLAPCHRRSFCRAFTKRTGE
ncbi:MAG: hypothetical protein WCP87_02605, partial [Atribacterota bacterium]